MEHTRSKNNIWQFVLLRNFSYGKWRPAYDKINPSNLEKIAIGWVNDKRLLLGLFLVVMLPEDLLALIKLKLNPRYGGRRGFEHRVSFSSVCQPEEFSAMFPHTKELEVKTHSQQFTSRRKVKEMTINNVRNLDHILGMDWDTVFNKGSVGFCMPPITFRLQQTKINSNQAKLSYDIDIGCETTILKHSRFTLCQ